MNYCKCPDVRHGRYEKGGQLYCDNCNQPVYDVIGLLLDIRESLRNMLWELDGPEKGVEPPSNFAVGLPKISQDEK